MFAGAFRAVACALILFSWVYAEGAPASQPASQPASARSTVATSRVERELKRLRQLVEDLTERVEEAEQADATPTQQRRLNIYGFLDVTLHKFFPESGSFFEGVAYDTLTFLMNRINLYVDSQMTSTLRALVELRFSFSPLGRVNQYGRVLEPPFDTGNGPFLRENTTVLNNFNSNEFRLGGVVIERAYFTWRPHEAFGVMAGRYLTPVGIWNVDHGSPVIIPVRAPYVALSQSLPLAQTGLQVFGRVHFSDRQRGDYAFTVSNGRGPMESVYDLDNNKALGLRLRWSFTGDRVKLALGGYGYWGRYTDYEVNIIELGALLKPTFEQTTTVEFDEILGAVDLKLEGYGWLFQSEAMVSHRKYAVGTGAVDGSDVIDQFMAYWLLAYELPLKRWIGDRRMRPFLMIEYGRVDERPLSTMDSSIYQNGVAVVWGLNFQPNPWLTAKVEGMWAQLLSDLVGEPQMWSLSMQTAVAF